MNEWGCSPYTYTYDEIQQQAGNVRFQFKSGSLAWVKPSELVGVCIARAWDRSLGVEVFYQA